jgi:uroporphyrinogen decarboxylase
MYRWQPAVYEHKAALIGKTPSEVSRNAEALALACKKELELYGAEVAVVGIDVYNVELEALGAKLKETQDNQCPDLAEELDDLEHLPETLPVCKIPDAGRFGTILKAAQLLKAEVDASIRIVIPVSGPMSLASKWVGMEDLIMDMFGEGENSDRLLSYFEQIALDWTRCILDHGFEAIVFDSMAAPPMMSPILYEQHLLRRHTHIFDLMKEKGQAVRELVIGGNTTSILEHQTITGKFPDTIPPDFPDTLS